MHTTGFARPALMGLRGTPIGVMIVSLLIAGCEAEVDSKPISAEGSENVVLAWNDLGMHCLNPTYDQAVILPPYNTLWAQVVRRGNPPAPVTEGLTVEYQVLNNTSSDGKTDDLGGVFAQFWDNVLLLFGAEPARDYGLNLRDPAISNGLSGAMVVDGDHFVADGIPLTPVDDDGVWNPYQVAEITVRDSGGAIVAQTRATIPTSDEIDCQRCHGAADPFGMAAHDEEHETTLVSDAPVLCASCHGSPALGATAPGEAGIFLSDAIHGGHAERGATCYDCHPGERTRCNRSDNHTAEDGNCTTCHGSMAQVSESIRGGERTPWVDEPRCASCHEDIAEVDTGTTLYRNAIGHGGLRCPACHGSPHAQVPSRETSDNYQAQQYQTASLPLGSCAVCHQTNHGEGAGEFGETHGGTGGQASACRVCHTVVLAETSRWPHRFQWRQR